MKSKGPIIAIILNIFFSDLAYGISPINNLADVHTYNSPQKLKLKGKVTKVISKGEKIQITPDSIFNSEQNISGDYFSALMSDIDANKYGIPKGSKLIGEISKAKNAKSFNRDGQIEVHVTELLLPSGDRISVDANFISAEEKPIKHFVKKVAKESAELTAGTLAGASDAFEIGGLYAATASYGISIAAGGALGLGLSLYNTTTQKGEIESNIGFGSSTLKLKDDFVFLEELPIMSQELKPIDAKLFGINLTVKEIQKMFSNEFGDFLVFDVDIENNTARKLYLGDFVLRSQKNPEPILHNPLISGLDALSSVDIQKKSTCRLAFSLADFDKHEGYKLELIDPITEKIIADFKIDIRNLL